jgi:hypothetical protein
MVTVVCGAPLHDLLVVVGVFVAARVRTWLLCATMNAGEAGEAHEWLTWCDDDREVRLIK